VSYHYVAKHDVKNAFLPCHCRIPSPMMYI
jgi:hypothetical protein